MTLFKVVVSPTLISIEFIVPENKDFIIVLLKSSLAFKNLVFKSNVFCTDFSYSSSETSPFVFKISSLLDCDFCIS